MPFVLFEKEKCARRVFPPRVFFNTKYGTFVFNKACFSEYFNGAGFCELFFDQENGKVGIKPRDNKTISSYKIYKSKGTSSSTTSPGFVREYQLKSLGAKSYECKWNEEEKLVEFNLED